MRQRFFLTLFFAGLLAIGAFSQSAPQGFNYQSIIRNASGAPLVNQTVSLLFAIRSGSPNGNIAYYEKHTASTNEFGLVTLIIGQGTSLQGDFTTVDWGGASKYLTVSIESSPNVFDELGSSQLLSVPYALYAQNGPTSGNSDNWGSQTAFTNNTLTGNGLAGAPLGIAQQSAQNGQVLKWNGTSWAPADDNTGSSGGSGTVTQINTGAGLTGGPITNSGTIALTNTGVTPGAYGSATEIPVVSVDAQGRVTNIFKTFVQPGTVGLNSGTGISVQTNGFNNFTIVNTGDTNASDDLSITTQADGDVNGVFSNLQLKSNVVGSGELQNGAVTAAKLASMNASSGQILKWNGTAWAPAADNTGSVSLTSGTGITISGTAPNYTITNAGDTNGADDVTTSSQANGDVTGPFSNLQLKVNVVTNAEIADNAVGTTEISDNAVGTSELANGAVTAAKLASMNASNGQVLKWNGSAWAPAADQGGTFDVLPGAGIDVTQNGNNFTVINTGDTNGSDDLTTTSQANGDVTGPFSNLQIKANVVTSNEIADNAVNTSELSNGAVTGVKLANMGALTNQILKWNGTTWAPANDNGGAADNWGTQTAVTGIALSGNGTAANPLNLAPQGASVGQVLKWSGAAWVPNNDQTGSGTGDAYFAGPGISITGSSPNFTINNIGDADNNAQNEIQQLSIAGNQISLSNGGGTVTLPPGGGGGNNYTAGPGISITGTAPNQVINNIGDADSDTANELQTLALNGTVLEISQNGSSVDLAPLLTLNSTDEWMKAGNNIFNTNTGNVLIGTNTSTSGKLQVVNGNAAHEAGRFLQTGGTKSAIYAEANAGAGGYFSSISGPALITGTGNVGIGATIPAARLHVSGNGESVRLQGNLPSISFVTTGGTGIGGYIKEVAPNFLIGSNNEKQNIYLLPGGKKALFAEADFGNVSIGSDSEPLGKLHVFHEEKGFFIENTTSSNNWEFWVDGADGNLSLFNNTLGGIPAGTFATNGLYTPSDRRLKKDIVTVPAGTLEKLMKLEPVSYRYTAEKASAQPSIGFLAQDVDLIFPELVAKRKQRSGSDVMLSLNYAGFGVLAIKAIQEQQVQLEALKKENEILQVKTASLTARLEQLEQAVRAKKD